MKTINTVHNEKFEENKNLLLNENPFSKIENQEKSLSEEKIGICFLIYSIRNINTGDSSFQADIGFYLNWKDSNIALDNRSNKEITETIKSPPIKIVNAISEEIYRENMRIIDKNKGEINNFQCRRCLFHNNFDLRRFPFDSQKLYILLKCNRILETSNYSGEYTNSKHESYFLKECDKNSGWKLNHLKNRHYFLYDKKTSYYVVVLHYDRLTLFFYANVFSPIFILIFLSFTCYGINATDYSNRLNVCLIVLLTLAAFRFSLQDTLPKLSYMTVFDKYNISGLIFVLGECIFNFIISLLLINIDPIKTDEINQADFIFHIVIASLWFLWSFGYLTYHSLWKEKDFQIKKMLEEISDVKCYLPEVEILNEQEIKDIKDLSVKKIN